MTFIFDSSTKSPALTSVAPSQKIEDKKDVPGASREIGIVIFTEPGDKGHTNFANRLINKCIQGDISAIVDMLNYTSMDPDTSRGGQKARELRERLHPVPQSSRK
jgi:hypothetical protein